MMVLYRPCLQYNPGFGCTFFLLSFLVLTSLCSYSYLMLYACVFRRSTPMCVPLYTVYLKRVAVVLMSVLDFSPGLPVYG